MKKLANTLIAFTATALLLSAAHAGLLDDDEARKAILELRTEVRRNDADQAQKIQQLTEQLSNLGIVSANSMVKLRSDLAEQSKQIDSLRGTILDLNTALKATRDDNAKLRGMIEVAQNNVQLSQRDQQRDQLATKQRLQDLDTAYKQKLQELEQANDARLKKLEPRTVAIDGKEALVDKAEEANFNAALNQFKAADYKSASRGFESFVAQYPSSGLIASAYYWLGSSQYAAREPKSAIAQFQTMIAKAPQHPRAADAYLTMGHAYDELGDKKRSVAMYETVIKQYPNTAAAAAAPEYLPKPATKKPVKASIKKAAQ